MIVKVEQEKTNCLEDILETLFRIIDLEGNLTYKKTNLLFHVQKHHFLVSHMKVTGKKIATMEIRVKLLFLSCRCNQKEIEASNVATGFKI